MANTITTGSKYHLAANLDPTAIATLIRADLVELMQARRSPLADVVKVPSVRVKRFAGGCSIDVVALIAGETHADEAMVDAQREARVPAPYRTRVAFNVQAAIEAIVEAYRLTSIPSDGDGMHANFYTSVSVRTYTPK